MFDPVLAGGDCDILGIATDDYSLDSVGWFWWLSLGLLHVKAESGIELFKGGEPRLGRPGRFDGSVVVDVVYHWDARDRASNG